MIRSLGNKLLENEIQGLIYMQTIMDVEVYLDIVRVLIGSQKADVSDVLEVSL